MRTREARQRVRVLLATTVLIAVSGFGSAPAVAQETPAQAKPVQGDQGLDANAQAITLSPIDVQGNSGGTDGYVANSTSVATKTNTPVINIPQSLSVVTKDFIKDAGFQNFTDFTRYVPGVAVHQGEGNRDELVIRGVDSSANFFVNGFRDDVQYFRDFYNAQSVEVLQRAERADLRARRRRRPGQPHAQGSRRHAGLRRDGADRILLGQAGLARCGPGYQ